MKLFGDTGKRARSVGAQQPVTAEKQRKAPFAFPDAPLWRKIRLPLVIVGALILILLLGLLVYSIWEKPPETATDGPLVQATVKPAVSSPVPETPNPMLPEETEAPEETEQPQETAQPTGEEAQHRARFRAKRDGAVHAASWQSHWFYAGLLCDCGL